MYQVTKYPHGTISWADCNTTDIDKALPFYTQLMGWGEQHLPMGGGLNYTMLLLDGDEAAAIAPMQPDMQAAGLPSLWNTYITVDDVDAMQALVTQHGGTIVAPPFDVFDNGRMMTIQDPSGGTVCLWQAKSHIGAKVVNKPGAMAWNELMTRDIEAAKTFFAHVLGWEYEKMGGSDYWVIKNKGRMNGGIALLGDDMAGVPPSWVVTFNVADIDATVEKAKQLGGQVVDTFTAEGIGRGAFISDPAGATFITMQMNQPDSWNADAS